MLKKIALTFLLDIVITGTVSAQSSITCTNLPAMVNGSAYSTLQAAYNNASNGATIEAEAVDFTQNLLFNSNISIELEGGYDCDYVSDSLYSTLTGTLTISSGTVTVSNLIITASTTSTTTTSTTTSTTSSTTSTSTVSTTTSTTSTVTTTSSSTTTTIGSGTNNVVSLTVNGSECDSTINSGYFNDPCISVTVCTPGTSTCQTINGILLDTGSYGLRIFQSLLTNVTLTQVQSGSGSLAECVEYADGSATWGPVQTASVILGNEPAVQVPIQVIDYEYPSTRIAKSVCRGSQVNDTPADAGFNGILGVGPFVQDCGDTCVSSSANGEYYSCSGSSCIGTTVSLANQVSNPVAFLPSDNNGLMVELPDVSATGEPSVSGSVVLGIGTQTNNSPAGATAYPLDQYGDFVTTFDKITYSVSFVDTGSNGLYFPSSGLLTDCTSGEFAGTGFFCPSSVTNLSATITGASGSPSNTVQFQIGNTNTLISSGNNVFNDIGADTPGQFDWGLPFFLGKSVFIGIEGTSSNLGTGPYFAY